jgi:UDP-glucose 4-epimerase
MEEKGDTPNSVNFGPNESLSVINLISLFEVAFSKKIEFDVLESHLPESDWLALDSGLARAYYGWKSSLSAAQAIKQTADWYSKFENGADAKELMISEILKYKEGKW